VVPADSSRTSSAFSPKLCKWLFLVQPPLDARLTSVAQVVGDLVEEDVRAVDRAVNAAHALVSDGSLDGRAGGGVVEGDAHAAVGVGVGERAHEGERQRDGEVGVGVDDGAAGAKATIPVRDVADAGVVAAFAGAGCGAGADGTWCGGSGNR
jgi:hypothetical protein